MKNMDQQTQITVTLLGLVNGKQSPASPPPPHTKPFTIYLAPVAQHTLA